MKNGIPALFQKVWFWIVVFMILVVIQQWPKASGEDITHSREFFEQQLRSDFLGSIATVFYGVIPDTAIAWYHLLLLLQVGLTGLGLYLIFKGESLVYSRANKIGIILILYIGIIIGSAQTRDGALFSFSIFGIGLYLESKKTKDSKMRASLSVLAWFFLIVGFSFRPWLSVALPFIFLSLSKLRSPRYSLSKASAIGIVALLLVSPFVIDQSAKKVWDLQNGYPQQIVMIHDLAASYCWSVDIDTVKHAGEGLSALATNPKALQQICQFFKPNTWQAVAGLDPVALPTQGMRAPVSLINVNDSTKYDSLQTAWINVIANDPFTYIQNHLSFGTQVLVSGESRNIGAIRAVQALLNTSELGNLYNLLLSLFMSVYEVFISFHLLSPFILFMYLIVSFIRNRNSEQQLVAKISVRYAILAFILWFSLTAIAFASDNGRYTYTPIYFVYLVIMLETIGKSRNSSTDKKVT
jgi:hypothetical protein